MTITKVNQTALSSLGVTVTGLFGFEDVNFIKTTTAELLSKDGAVATDQTMSARVFGFKGRVKASSAAEADIRMRKLLALCRRNGDNTNNTIEGTMGGNTFLIDAYLNGSKVRRERDTVDFIDFEVQMVAPQPALRRNTSTQTEVVSSYTGSNASDLDVNVSGTYRPRVKIILELTQNDTGGTVIVEDLQTGSELQFTRLDQGGVTNTITIDCWNKSIIQDDGTTQTELEPTGRFPICELSNLITAATPQINLRVEDDQVVTGTVDVKYTPQWL